MDRGPEYADQLTDPERRTLEALVTRVERRNARYERAGVASLRAPIAAGLAALAILLVTTMVAQLGDSSPPGTPPVGAPAGPPAGAPTDTRSAFDALQDLAAAATAAPPPATRPAVEAYLHRLDVIVVAGGATPGHCRVTALDIEVWQTIEVILDGAPTTSDKDEPKYSRLEVERAQPPEAALTGCATTFETYGPVPASFQGNLHEAWEELARELGSDTPRPGDLLIFDTDAEGALSHLLADLLALTEPPHRWWQALVRLLASPQEPGVAATALEAAARWTAEAPDGTVQLLGRDADVTGRPGISLRVPYPTRDGRPSTAELTLDPDTGALLQLLVDTGAGTEITAYLAIRFTESGRRLGQ